MKPVMALKPLVFAIAALMAVAAQAGGGGNGNGGGNNNNNDQLLTQLQLSAGAAAMVQDGQTSANNKALNQGTHNLANVNGSINNSSGNMGANVAAGDGNQQDNAAALATADQSFIFGSAVAATTADQGNYGNTVRNYSAVNVSSLNNSANNGSGNVGVNVTTGSFNQQKNNLAIAVSGGRVAVAAASADQTSTSLNVSNKAVQTYDTKNLTASINLHGAYHGQGQGTVGGNSGGGGGNHNSSVQGGNGGGNGGGNNGPQPLRFHEEGTFSLSGVATYQVLTPSGWTSPTINHASMTNSMNNFSGNGGANVSSGVGNQQSNSLSIAAGCRACM